jgi:hypothetical protein
MSTLADLIDRYYIASWNKTDVPRRRSSHRHGPKTPVTAIRLCRVREETASTL